MRSNRDPGSNRVARRLAQQQEKLLERIREAQGRGDHATAQRLDNERQRIGDMLYSNTMPSVADVMQTVMEK